MVTGVETAGLILATLPLIISALASYRRGLERCGNLRSMKFALRINRLIVRLKSQRTHYRIILSKLVKLARSDVALDELTDDYVKDIWAGETGMKMREYLQSVGVLESFQETIEVYENLMKEIVKKLQGISRDQNAAQDDLGAILRSNPRQDLRHRFTQRIQFIMNEDDIRRLTNDLNESNLSLERFVDRTQELHDLEASHPSKRKRNETIRSLVRFRKHADALFWAMCVGCTPQCHPSHSAMLYLENRCLRRPSKLRHDEDIIRFRILFSPGSTSSMPTWHETTITVLEDQMSCIASETSPPITPSSTRVPRVQFDIPVPAVMQMSPCEVKNLCEEIIIAQQMAHNSCLHLSENKKLFWRSSDNLNPPKSLAEELITLDRCLCQMNTLGPKKQLHLAANITSSLLQYNATPWLRKCWTKDAIYFVQHPRQLRRVDIDHPLISEELLDRASFSAPEDRPDLALLELGILLLEVWLGQTIESWSSGLGHTIDETQAGRSYAAIKWWNHVKGGLPLDYRKVVGRCLHPACIFDDFTVSWEDADFQCAVYENVLSPLLISSQSLDSDTQREGCFQ